MQHSTYRPFREFADASTRRHFQHYGEGCPVSQMQASELSSSTSFNRDSAPDPGSVARGGPDTPLRAVAGALRAPTEADASGRLDRRLVRPSPVPHVRTDVLSDVLRAVRLTGAVYFDFELSSPWVAEAPPSPAIADRVMPGAQRVIEYHLIA